MVANRNRVEHAITESLNGAQIGDPVTAVQRELATMRRQDPQNYLDNVRMFERMTRNSNLLPHLDLSGLPPEDERRPNPARPRHAERPRASTPQEPRRESRTELPIPPERPEQPTRSTGQERSAMTSNPISIPGMASPEFVDPRIRRDGAHTFPPVVTETAEGRTIRQRGIADAGNVGLGRGVTSPYESTRVEDRAGNLVRGRVDYPGTLNIRLQTVDGVQTLRCVSSAETVRNRDNTYTTTFNYYNGRATAVTDANGRTRLTLPRQND